MVFLTKIFPNEGIRAGIVGMCHVDTGNFSISFHEVTIVMLRCCQYIVCDSEEPYNKATNQSIPQT